MAEKTCFVVMGFGEKTDYQTQRTLDLDKTYRVIIQPAVEGSGLKCVRADDIVHSGVIDKPMYEQLLEADLVVADLSTSNQNAIYELGVRHALRPNTTIVIAEDKFCFPFDLGHVVIRKYKHLGTGIDYEEVERMRQDLVGAIQQLVFGETQVDSPVYTFLPRLSQPVNRTENGDAMTVVEAGDAGDAGDATDRLVFSALLERARAAMRGNDFVTASALFTKLHEINPSEAYVTQQLALATYKCPQPDADGKRQALLDAHRILEENLAPETTHDPETLGLWGAVHKRLWDIDHQREHLDRAIASYERGFYLKRDYYNGINYAYLLNERAAQQQSGDEATADRVLASRVRQQVLALADQAQKTLPREADGNPQDPEQAYWIAATRLEALHGLGQHERLSAESDALFANAPAAWMVDSTKRQLKRLDELL